MSRGCGDNAAALAEVTASAVAQRIDFIVNIAIVDRVTVKLTQENIPTYQYPQYIPMAVGSTSCGDVGACRPPRCLSCRRSYIASNMTWFSPSG
jgi:hypothetical protein